MLSLTNPGPNLAPAKNKPQRGASPGLVVQRPSVIPKGSLEMPQPTKSATIIKHVLFNIAQPQFDHWDKFRRRW